jgi:hypothetical protein
MRLFTTILLSFLFLAAYGQHDHRNCGTMEALEQQLQQDPEMRNRMEAIERHTERYIQGEGVQFRAVITIPVVFHIVHNGDALGTNENISDALIMAQLSQLNQDFRKLNSDASLIPSLFQGVAADTEIEFCLAQRKPDGTATNGINRVQTSTASWSYNQIQSNLKPSTIWDRNQYLNVWSVQFGGGDANLLGFAQFPGGAANTDGVVVAYSTVGSVALPNPVGGNYARGRTLTHEVGHWLNLRHIWGDATCGNDFVADTPVHNTSNGGCPAYPHYSTCSGTPVEMTMNYMDYTFDACMYMFTAGQSARMNAVLASGGARVSLLSSPGCTPPSGGGSCAVPSGLNATNITTNSATLNWGSVSGATSYDVRARQVGTSTWSNGSVTGTSANFTGLTANTQYEFQVQAVCGGSTSGYSSSATFTTSSAGCTDNYEPNNSRSSSLPLSPTGVDLIAQIATSTDNDWYRFANTSAQRNIRLDLTNLPADYDLRLYQNNTLRRTSQNGGTTPEVCIWNTSTVASNWYAHVYGYNGAFSNTQCYTLRITLSSSSFREDGTTDGEVTELEVPVYVERSGFAMFPNPAADEVTLDVATQADGPVRVSLIDITGKALLLRTYDLAKGDSQITLDVSQLPAGTFFVRVENGETVGVQKLMIMRQ